MGYHYQTQRPNVFTEDGQVMFLKIRDNAKVLLSKSGAATSGRIMNGVSGDTWDMLACIDRLVELGELHEIPNTLSGAGQHRVFVAFD